MSKKIDVKIYVQVLWTEVSDFMMGKFVGLRLDRYGLKTVSKIIWSQPSSFDLKKPGRKRLL